MVFLDFFENMSLGLTIIMLSVFILLIIFVGNLISVFLMGFGRLLYLLVPIILVGAIIYFIGKFAKDFIKAEVTKC
jgi:hypothetical protein